MEHLFTYDLIVQYSFSGKSDIRGEVNKLVFSENVGIISLVKKTITSFSESSNDDEALKGLILFLRRGNQNKMRQLGKTAIQDCDSLF
jgi:hypothetical protein